jgi:Tfp pilus assembly protein PilN
VSYTPRYNRNYAQIRQYYIVIAKRLARRIGDKQTLTELKHQADTYTLDKIINILLRLDKAAEE